VNYQHDRNIPAPAVKMRLEAFAEPGPHRDHNAARRFTIIGRQGQRVIGAGRFSWSRRQL